MQLKGKIKVINDELIITDKFKKREFVITDDSSQYPQDIILQLTQDRTDLIDSYSVGQEITASFNLRGREWTSPTGEVRYFNTIEAWKIEGETIPATEVPAPTVSTDDLPF
tara:strand:+ start:1194 stop:1526 length:333 start_codon:yes stop_codon:yes gene_type:complete